MKNHIVIIASEFKGNEFIEEAQNVLPTVRGSILLCTKEGNTKSELDASIKHMHTIKGASAMIGVTEVSDVAKDLEQDLVSYAETDKKLTDKQSNDLLDKLSKMEALVSELNFGLDEFEIDASQLVEESFDNLQPNDLVMFEQPSHFFSKKNDTMQASLSNISPLGSKDSKSRNLYALIVGINAYKNVKN